MVYIDLSNWLSDWLCHFLSSGAAALLAFWLTWTILSGLFRRAGFPPRFCATWPHQRAALGTITMSLAASLFACLLAHYVQDCYLGPFIHIEFVWRIL